MSLAIGHRVRRISRLGNFPAIRGTSNCQKHHSQLIAALLTSLCGSSKSHHKTLRPIKFSIKFKTLRLRAQTIETRTDPCKKGDVNNK